MKASPVYIRFPEETDAAELAALYARNREFFETFSPGSPDSGTEAYQLRRIVQGKEDREADRKYSFVICRSEDGRIVGSVELAFIQRGALQCGMIGYSLDQACNGRGWMTEAVKQAVRFAFEELKLHRVYGEATLRNIGSIRVLEKAGFHREGVARSKLMLNGVWEDLQVMAIINPADGG
jgi:ribosomal-protein-alanine N-acetyltransferase